MTMGTSLPLYDQSKSETKCCSLIEPAQWDNLEVVFDDELFLRVRTVSFMHVPLNMGAVMKRTWNAVEKEKAAPQSWVMLSHDSSPWHADHYLAVSKAVSGMETVTLPGTYLTKVFEGPYKDAPKWHKEMAEHVKSRGREIKKMYFFYTVCPKCAKHYGKNYTVAFAQV